MASVVLNDVILHFILNRIIAHIFFLNIRIGHGFLSNRSSGVHFRARLILLLRNDEFLRLRVRTRHRANSRSRRVTIVIMALFLSQMLLRLEQNLTPGRRRFPLLSELLLVQLFLCWEDCLGSFLHCFVVFWFLG